MKYLRCVIVLFVSLSSVISIHNGSIDYRKAAEIFRVQAQSYEENDVAQTRTYFTDPVNLKFSSVARFINFMRDHEKNYSSEDELFKRHENFIANVAKAEDYQSLDRGSATYSVNKFFDFSDGDLKHLIGLKVSNADQYLPPALLNLQQRQSSYIDLIGTDDEHQRTDSKKPSVRVPTSVDWRQKGVISQVKFQGYCSSCWAFSAMGVVEAMHAIRSDNLTELSVQQLVDCDSGNGGCNGGTMDTAYQYIIDAGGVVSAKDYPYIGLSQKGCLMGDNKFKVQVKKYKRIQNRDENVMMKWIATHGPLSVGVNADGLFYYAGGVIDLRHNLCHPKKQNHALIVVGYGKEKREGQKSIPYWIVKNSWGEDWGEKGYFRIRRGSNTCGIGEFVHGVITK